jgi:hypothetical protein
VYEISQLVGKIEIQSNFHDLHRMNLNSYLTALPNIRIPQDFEATMGNANSLFPIQSGKLPEQTFFEVNVPKLKYNFPITLGSYIDRICPIFEDSTFTTVLISHVSPIKFLNCTIDEIVFNSSRANLHFENCTVKKMRINNGSPIRNVGFYGGSIGEIDSGKKEISHLLIADAKVQLGAFQESKIIHTKFVKVTFAEAPSFIESKMDKTVFFHNCNFLEFNLNSQAFYRELRKHLHQNNDEETAAMFGALELKSKHALLKWKDDKLDWVTSTCYKLINDFGLDTYKPLRWLGLQFIVSFFIFLALCKEQLVYKETAINGEYGQALYLAFVSSIGPLRLLVKLDSHNPSQIIGELAFLLLNLVSTVLWFFLIFGVRRKYKLP